MKRNELSVFYSRKDTYLTVVIFIIIEIILLMIMFTSNHILLDVILTISFFILSLLTILVSIMFRIDVSDSTIKVRTRFGKHLQFDCSEIEKVVCSKRDSVKFGPQFYIEINFTTYDVRLNAGMVGFEEMAGYLLEKYENGEIKESAISKSCKKTLANHRDYVHTKNLKKKNK